MRHDRSVRFSLVVALLIPAGLVAGKALPAAQAAVPSGPSKFVSVPQVRLYDTASRGGGTWVRVGR